MNLATFDALRNYETTSWACWSDDEDSSIAFFRRNLDRLHSRAIFLGLNRSEAWSAHLVGIHMPNFHTAGHAGDRRLKRFIQDAELSNLIGGFMTDLSEEIKSNSYEVKIDRPEAIRSLKEKLAHFEIEDTRAFVYFGDKTFDKFSQGA